MKGIATLKRALSLQFSQKFLTTLKSKSRGRIFTFGVFGVEILKQAPPSFRTDDGFALVTLNSVQGLFFVSESQGLH